MAGGLKKRSGIQCPAQSLACGWCSANHCTSATDLLRSSLWSSDTLEEWALARSRMIYEESNDLCSNLNWVTDVSPHLGKPLSLWASKPQFPHLQKRECDQVTPSPYPVGSSITICHLELLTSKSSGLPHQIQWSLTWLPIRTIRDALKIPVRSRSKKNYNPAACGMKTTFTER